MATPKALIPGGDHAVLSPSGSPRWVACAASVVEERGRRSPSTVYNTSGTATHELAARCLREGSGPRIYTGERMMIGGFEHEVDQDRADRVSFYLETVYDILAECEPASLLVEQSVPLEFITGERGATGTADALIVADEWLTVIDLKDGQEEVEAENNTQLGIYALGAIDAHFLTRPPFRMVRMVIVQPRHRAVSEWVLTVEELEALRGRVKQAARRIAEASQPGVDLKPYYAPGEKQCRWCQVKATCPALRASVAAVLFTDATADDFPDLTALPDPLAALAAFEAPAPGNGPAHADAPTIARLLPALDMIKVWIDAVRARGEELLLAGVAVEGWKLVTGKQGNRAWTDPAAAEAALKKMRLKQAEMYDLKLISPTTAEKRLQDAPRRWKALQPLIDRADGRPTVVPVSDKRPALAVTPVADHFEDLTVSDATTSTPDVTVSDLV